MKIATLSPTGHIDVSALQSEGRFSFCTGSFA